MTNQTFIETQNKFEIGNYTSPEALAKALEEKSKTEIAKKIRQIASEVRDESIDLRTKLKEVLSNEEQKQIREALPTSDIQSVFDKGLTEGEKVIGEAGSTIAAMVPGETGKIEEHLGKFDSFIKRFDDAGEVYKRVSEAKGGIAGTFAGIMAAIMYFLTGKTPEGMDFSFDKKDGEEKGKEKNGEIDIKYQISSSAVSKIFGGDSKDTLNKLFAIDKFQQLSYAQIKELYSKYKNVSDKDSLAKDVGIEGVKGIDVFNALGVLVDEQKHSGKLLPDFYKKKGEDYESKSIKELISGLYTNIKIFKSLENITTPDQIINAGKNFGLQIEQLGDGKIDIKGEIYESLNELGISKNIIVFIQMRGGFKNIDELEKNLDGIQSELTAEDKKMLAEKLIPFAKNINKTLATNFGGKYSNDVLNCLNKTNLDLKETLELFALTGGNYEYEKMNDMQKTYIYTKLINILDDRDYELAGKYATYIVKEGETPLPGGVLNMLSYLGGKLKDGGEKIGKNLLGAAKENPVMAGIIALTLWFGPLFSSKESINKKMGRLFKI